MLWQNSEGMSDKIKAIGCFFKSCVAIAEMHLQKTLTAEQHNRLWDECVDLLYIVDDDIKSSAKIIQLTFTKLGHPRAVVEIGNSSSGFYGWVKAYPVYQQIQFRIQKIKQNGPSKYHFRVVDAEGNVIFEPHNPEIHSLGEVYTIWYRLVP